MPSKYDSLERYLKDQPASVREVTLAFDKIEVILANELNESAFTYREWWSNERRGSHVQARSWMDAGWRVETVSLSQRSVRFLRE